MWNAPRPGANSLALIHNVYAPEGPRWLGTRAKGSADGEAPASADEERNWQNNSVTSETASSPTAQGTWVSKHP